MIIGERLKLARKQKKISQSALARKAGMTPSAISQIEGGLTKKPSAENLLPLAAALEVDANWLITGKGDMQPKVIPETRYDYIDSAGAVPEFSEKVEEAMAIIRTLSLHPQPIDDDVRGELNNILKSLVMAHAQSKAELREPAGDYAANSDEQTLIDAYRMLDIDMQQSILMLATSLPHKDSGNYTDDEIEAIRTQAIEVHQDEMAADAYADSQAED